MPQKLSRVRKIVDLNKVSIDAELPSRNYIQHENLLYYTEIIDEDVTYLEPGIFKIVDNNYKLILVPTQVNQDLINKTVVSFKLTAGIIKQFFNNLTIYRDLGMEVPKRGVMLYGPPGTGKTTLINSIISESISDTKTIAVFWPTAAVNSASVKDFLHTFNYENISRLIFIMEDIGGIENMDVSVKSDSDLLSILDNQDNAFKVPTLMIGTTNYPELLMENLSNRPGRFDDKIEISAPNQEDKIKVLEFLLKQPIDDLIRTKLSAKKCESLTMAHIKEIVVRHKIYSISVLEAIQQVLDEREKYTKAFSKRSGSFGLEV